MIHMLLGGIYRWASGRQAISSQLHPHCIHAYMRINIDIDIGYGFDMVSGEMVR
jgi:hypothetical protein